MTVALGLARVIMILGFIKSFRGLLNTNGTEQF
jgi:hypothetical protein